MAESGSHRVLRWDVGFDGPWSADAVRRYRDGGFNGLSLSPGRDWAPENLDFLAELPDLRLLSARIKVRRDLAAFHLAALEDLTLVTGSRLPVPDVVQPRLRRLCVTDRPGLDIGARWPMLDWFRLGTWRGTDCQLLGKAPRLSTAYLEGRRQAGTLAGVEGCPSLTSLTTVNYSVQDTAPLRALDNLVEVKLLAARPAGPHGRIDAADLAGPRLTTLWIANAPDLLNIEALLDAPALRELRLIDCGLTESDWRTLAALPRHVGLRVVDNGKIKGELG